MADRKLSMECSEVNKILYEDAILELSPGERRVFEEHLKGCRACSAHFAALSEQTEALRSLPRLDAPSGFLERVKKGVEEKSPNFIDRLRSGIFESFGTTSFLRIAAGAAAMFLVVFTGQQILQHDKGKQEALLVAPLPPPPRSQQMETGAPAAPQVPAPAAAPQPPAQAVAPPVAMAPQPKPSTASPPAEPGLSADNSVSKEPAARMQAETPKTAKKSLTAAAPQKTDSARAEARKSESIIITMRVNQPSSVDRLSEAPPAEQSVEKQAPASFASGASTDAPRAPGATLSASAPISRKAENKQTEVERAAPRTRQGEDFSTRPGPADFRANTITEVRRLVSSARGIIVEEQNLDAKGAGTLQADIPAENYKNFLQGLRRLGDAAFRYPAGESFSPRENTLVRVSIIFESRP